MGRPREHDETTRAALLAAAERLIDEEGPDGAGVRCVADAVGTSTRAVYSVFGSKQGLLEALAIRFFEELQAATDAVPLTDDPAADLVNAAMNAWRRTVLRHPSVYRLVFLRLVPDLELGPEFGQVAYGALGQLQALVERVAPRPRRARAHARLACVDRRAGVDGSPGPDARHVERRTHLVGRARSTPARIPERRHHRGARGIPKPARAMISRCTSFTPPPKVPTGAWRYAASS